MTDFGTYSDDIDKISERHEKKYTVYEIQSL